MEGHSRSMKRRRIRHPLDAPCHWAFASSRRLLVCHLTGAACEKGEFKYMYVFAVSNLVVSTTRQRDTVRIIRHLPDEHRVSLVGYKLLQALQICLQYGPELLSFVFVGVQFEEADAFHVIEERIAMSCPFVGSGRGRGMIGRQQLYGFVDDLPRDEPRDESGVCPARFSDKAGERYLRVLALLGKRRVLVGIKFDGDSVLRAEEQRLRFDFQLRFAFP